MWMTIISFIGGPVIKGLIDGYKAKLAVSNTSEKIESETASAEIAAQVSETNAIMQYRIAEIGHWYEPDKLMGYFVAIYFGKAVDLGQGSWPWHNRSARRFRGDHLETRQARFRERCKDHQAMTEVQAADVRAIVVETLAEQQRIRHEDIDAVVLKAVATTLNSFGIDEEDRKELRADFQHLRRWRRSVEQAQSYTLKAAITVIVTGFVGAVWLGIQATLGK